MDNGILKAGDYIGLVCCSDGHAEKRKASNEKLDLLLRQMGLMPVWSPYIYAKTSVFSASGKERAGVLNQMYGDDSIRAIFDLSGGNLGNGILEYLDYDLIRRNPKPFFGYSDLTTVLSAIYTKTGNPGCLYQLRFLVGEHGILQQNRFSRSLFYGAEDLWSPSFRFLRGELMEGVLVGGNLRCLLKLAGTPYFPDLTGKVLFLEGMGGGVGAITAMLTQLRLMGAFQKISGLLLGTFTEMERDALHPTVPELALSLTEDLGIPLAVTSEVGHGFDAKALWIGKTITLQKGAGL